jgi:hypothetical protein
MRCRIHWTVLHLGARRICPKEVVLVPIRRRSDRSRYEPAAAIGADISQNAFDTRNTEGALIRADARLKRIRRQRLIAVLAGRSKFKHENLDVQLPEMGNQWFLEHFSVHPLYLSLGEWPRLSFTGRIEGCLIYLFDLFKLAFSLLAGDTHVGLRAAVERGPSQGARSGSTGPAWVPPACPFHRARSANKKNDLAAPPIK